MQIVCLACVWVLTAVWTDDGFAAPDPASGAPHMQLPSESVVGVVLYPDGSTPVPDLPVHVWNVAKERFVYRTRTNNEGGFEIPWMREGRSYILVGNVKVDLQVMVPEAGMAGQRHDIVVVMPRRMLIGEGGPRLIHVFSAPLLMAAPLISSPVSP